MDSFRDLAVADFSDTIYVYKNATGLPTTYTDTNEFTADVAYDSSGDLFVVGFSETNGFLLSELPAKSNSFEHITVEGSAYSDGETPYFGTVNI